MTLRPRMEREIDRLQAYIAAHPGCYLEDARRALGLTKAQAIVVASRLAARDQIEPV